MEAKIAAVTTHCKLPRYPNWPYCLDIIGDVEEHMSVGPFYSYTDAPSRCLPLLTGFHVGEAIRS